MKRVTDFFLGIVDTLEYGVEVTKWFIGLVKDVALRLRSFPTRPSRVKSEGVNQQSGTDKSS